MSRPPNPNFPGRRFGRLIVETYIFGSKNRRGRWKCICDCGNEAIVRIDALKTGFTKSCGCLNKETQDRLLPKYRFKHGKSKSKIHAIYFSMIGRCYNKNNHKFKNYGARGIEVCASWHDFENFYKDMGDPPNGKTLGRIDNNKGYTPSNCRWETHFQQANNRSNNLFIYYRGCKQTLQQWSNALGIQRETLRARLIRGWSVKKAIETPVREGAYNGIS